MLGRGLPSSEKLVNPREQIRAYLNSLLNALPNPLPIALIFFFLGGDPLKPRFLLNTLPNILPNTIPKTFPIIHPITLPNLLPYLLLNRLILSYSQGGAP